MIKKVTLLFSLFVLTANFSIAKALMDDKIKNQDRTSIYESQYTSIAEKDCRTLDSDNMGSIQECEPYQNIFVKVLEGDIRQSITLRREEKEYALNFWLTITDAFSSLGSKIEWRYKVDNPHYPVGLIVRLDVTEEIEDMEHRISYLIVSKITHNQICVVGKILPQANQTLLARSMLEHSEKMPCLTRITSFH